MQIVFHWYGLIVGAAMVASILAFEWQARRFAPRLFSPPLSPPSSPHPRRGTSPLVLKNPETRFWLGVLLVCLGGTVGARLWHVLTDWPLYVDDPLAVLYLWQGGLSILGAVVGGTLILHVVRSRLWPDVGMLLLADLVALSLPVGQVIGRLANWVNQELYGLPLVGLPWALYIDPVRRLVGFSQFERFHPLFAYEMLAVGVFGAWLWYQAMRAFALGKTQQSSERLRENGWVVGSGFYAASYLLFYSWTRFCLDFLRIERGLVLGGALGFNQWVLLGATAVAFVWLYQLKQLRRVRLLLAGLLVVTVLIGGLIAASAVVPRGLLAGQKERQGVGSAPIQDTRFNQKLRDHQLVQLQLGEQVLNVEVVTTPESWTQGLSGRSEIGADGMLFIFPDQSMRHFWMVDMQFDLDMVWIDDGVVRSITPNVPRPQPDQARRDLPTYSSQVPVNWVLELPAGKARDYGIVEGSNAMMK